ncbi:MAG TPA: CBS domain-containing protein [Opitutaceae bacterium]|nr:CBS domain-containing protein [Opitutaceae bacterium]
MKIRQVMTMKVQCVKPADTLVQAAIAMRRLNIGAVPVCGENGKLVGMLTDRDITIRAVADGRDPQTTTVAEVLSPGIIYARDDQEVVEGVHLMEKYQIRRLPVVNIENQLVGIISLGDIATGATNRLSGEALQEVSSPASSAEAER